MFYEKYLVIQGTVYIVAFMKKINNEDILKTQSQMRKWVLGFAVLLSIKKNKSYAITILKDLKKADLLLVEGTLYPILSRLKKEGLLDYTWEESKTWPPRKYYTLTDRWEESLQVFTKTWNNLSNSISNLTKKIWKK